MMGKRSRNIHQYGAGNTVACLSLILVVCLCLIYCSQPVRADVTWSGDIDPADPTTWTSGTTGYIGKTSTGTLNITNGSDVLNWYAYIGYESGSTGEVTVDGPGSTWTNSYYALPFVGYEGVGTLNITGGGAVISNGGEIGSRPGSTGEITVDGPGSTWTSNWLVIGDYGSGTLNITNGGVVTTAERDIWVSRWPGSSGTIHFDNGTLTTGGGLLCASNDLTGTGTINAGGLVSDVDLVFDATHGLNQTFNINDYPSQNITVNLTVDGSGSMGAGHGGIGTMSISDGRDIESTTGHIGYKSGSTGVVTVDGIGSTWTNSSFLDVGLSGNGTLNITGGGAVSSAWGNIGSYSATGVVTVDGLGSTWTNNGSLYAGHWSSGTLNITGGGAVSNSIGNIGFNSGSTGVVTVDGPGSTWTNNDDLYVGRSGSGTLEITDDGLVSAAGTLTIDNNGGGDCFINMATGGMLALYGEADDSLFDFLGLIDGTDAIRYWDTSISDWADITGATYGQDYTLSYLTEGDLAGYTLLTVPEPLTLSLLILGGVTMHRRRRLA